jgi:hypothetical protein
MCRLKTINSWIDRPGLVIWIVNVIVLGTMTELITRRNTPHNCVVFRIGGGNVIFHGWL